MEFSYKIKRQPEAIIGTVCALAQDKLVVSGDEKQGSFTGLFEGTYLVEGDSASIVVTRKPLFISWGIIERGLKLLVL